MPKRHLPLFHRFAQVTRGGSLAMPWQVYAAVIFVSAIIAYVLVVLWRTHSLALNAWIEAQTVTRKVDLLTAEVHALGSKIDQQRAERLPDEALDEMEREMHRQAGELG